MTHCCVILLGMCFSGSRVEGNALYSVLLSRTYTPFYADPGWRLSAEDSFAVRLISNALFMVLSLDSGVLETLLKSASV